MQNLLPAERKWQVFAFMGERGLQREPQRHAEQAFPEKREYSSIMAGRERQESPERASSQRETERVYTTHVCER